MIRYKVFDSKYFSLICFIIFVCLFVSCGGDGDSYDESEQTNQYLYPLSGNVFYEEYIPTDTGLSNEIYTEPVRYANYEIVSEDGSLIKKGSLDKDGGYYAERKKDESIYVNIYSDTRFSGIANTYVVDSNGYVYIYTSPLITPDLSINTDITIRIVNHGQKSGAYNILDVASTCSKKMIDSTKIMHPELRITWELGNLNKIVFGKIVSSSFYSRSETIPTIYLVGGQETFDKSIDLESETAHFDDMVIAHEIGHFMLDHYSVDASQGGGHNGNNLYPSLSLSEGFATWFAAACLKNPNYLSTVGLPPKQQLNFSNYNIENIDNIPYRSFGIQSEFTVSEILWDIYDGSEDYSIDSDNDGIQINFDDIMHIFQLFRKQKDYPFLITFLDRLKDNNFLTELEISNLLQSPTDQYIEYPYPVVWPFQMELEMAYPIDGNPYFIGIPESGTIESESYLFSGSFFLNQFWSFFINKPLADIVITFGVKEEGISQILKLELYTIDNIFITAKQCKSGQYIQINESLLKGSYIIKIIAYDNNIEQYGRYWLSVEEN